MLSWRATESERQTKLPDDELLPEARGSSTHGITVQAPLATVWPWLVQMGCGRAGWYSYDRLDNKGIPSATSIRPELQDLRVSDILPFRPGSSEGFEVLRMDAPRLLVLGAYCRLPTLESLQWDAPRPKAFLRSTWGFYLREGQNETRLIVRARGVVQPRWVGFPVNLVMGPAHAMMQRKQLLNIRARVEASPG
ncbi:MAG: hypothetical protein BMS9Abin37_1411 [Acidobacteriota bacterium]|nr:MAG: hypothetical protein BMS9Abin37_1411 [Acidobacteriota bacterium]